MGMARWLVGMGMGLVLPALALAAEGLPPSVQQALNQARIPAGQVAVAIQPLDGRAPLLQHNVSQPLNPASVMKLVTTYAGLKLLGPAATWKTGAWSDGEVSSDGRLDAPLYLRGSGDPKLVLEHFTALLRQLRVRGLRELNGDLVLDRSAFALPGEDPGNFDARPMRPYNIGPDALLINFRAINLNLRPENGQVRVLNDTPAEGLRLDNRLNLTQEECGDWKDKLGLRLREEGRGAWRLELTGNFSSQCGEKVFNLAPLGADAQVESLFRALWGEQGGSFRGRVRSGVMPVGVRLLAQTESPTLVEVIRDINKYSNNVMARQLFLALDEQQPATLESARRRVKTWLLSRSSQFADVELDNGSGLSRRERISAQSLIRLLQLAWNDPLMPEFIASLPIVGVDGTMQKRLVDSAAGGQGHIKTGTLEGVKT
ncbi:MAG: hypothetical protein RIR00_388, partial [Pseudomonadota bacterium]